MQCNFVVDGNGAGAIPRMDKNAAIIGKFTLAILVKNNSSFKPLLSQPCIPLLFPTLKNKDQL